MATTTKHIFLDSSKARRQFDPLPFFPAYKCSPTCCPRLATTVSSSFWHIVNHAFNSLFHNRTSNFIPPPCKKTRQRKLFSSTTTQTEENNDAFVVLAYVPKRSAPTSRGELAHLAAPTVTDVPVELPRRLPQRRPFCPHALMLARFCCQSPKPRNSIYSNSAFTDTRPEIRSEYTCVGKNVMSNVRINLR